MGDRNWLGLPKSRTKQRIDNTLGVISAENKGKVKKYRDENLHRLQKYYDGTQYDNLAPWILEPTQEYIPVHKRKPSVQFHFVKRMASTLSSFMWGTKRFPQLKIEQDPDTEQYLKILIRSTRLESVLLQSFRHIVTQGGVFLRFMVIENRFIFETYQAQYCYPVLDTSGDLESIVIKYVYKDEDDKKDKWAKIELTKNSDILYDNPEAKENSDPIFEEVQRVDHNFGFVQGEWIRTAEVPKKVDGPSLVADVLDFVDELNYKISQSSTAIKYNIDPQLILKGLSEDEISVLVKSSSKGWNLGRDGDAHFLESNLGATETAIAFADKVKTNIQQISRILLMDPEKINAQSISGRALEIMHSPLVELIDELRPQQEKHLVNLLTKMAVVNLAIWNSSGAAPVSIPSGYNPKSFDMMVDWPPVFAPTVIDLQEKLRVAQIAASSQLISRETLTRWLAKDFGIEDVDLEVQKITDQPQINMFGGF